MAIVNLNKIKLPKQYLIQALTAFFIFFLVYTAGYKALNVTAFEFNIGRTGIFPAKYLSLVSYAVIMIEILVIISLMIKPQLGLKLYTVLMSLFSVYIIFLYYTGRYEVCGCGGILNGLGFKPHLVINISQVILGTIAVNLNSKK